jgi:hypothetical protein
MVDDYIDSPVGDNLTSCLEHLIVKKGVTDIYNSP